MIRNPLIRRAALASWDVICWSLAVAVVLGVRLDYNINDVQWRSAIQYWLLAGALVIALGYATKFYRGLFRVGSFDEAVGLAVHFGVVATISLAASVVFVPELPRSLPVLVPPVAVLLAAAGRWLFRSLRDRHDPMDDTHVKNAVVYGAGDAGYQILRLLKEDRRPPYRVVGFIDDNPGKRHLRMGGIPVVGHGASLSEVARQMEAEVVILAVTSATGQFVGQVQDAAQRAGLEFLVLPRLSELIGGRVELGDIRRVEIADVLGRHAVATDLSKIAGYLTGKRIMITGAGGSIGSELCRQVHRFGPSSLVCPADRESLHQCPVRQRAGISRLDAADLHRPDRGRRAGDRHAPGRDQIFHDYSGSPDTSVGV